MRTVSPHRDRFGDSRDKGSVWWTRCARKMTICWSQPQYARLEDTMAADEAKSVEDDVEIESKHPAVECSGVASNVDAETDQQDRNEATVAPEAAASAVTFFPTVEVRRLVPLAPYPYSI